MQKQNNTLNVNDKVRSCYTKKSKIQVHSSVAVTLALMSQTKKLPFASRSFTTAAFTKMVINY